MLLDIIYFIVILLSLPYLLFKVLTKEKYRTGLTQRLGFIDARPNTKPCIWVHGSSVGEILTGQRLINKLETEFPEHEIVISSWTNTGLATAKNRFNNKRAFYFPVDISCAIKSILKKIRPDYIILIELEIWPKFFITVDKYNIPIILVNGRISEKSMKFYQKLSFFSKNFHNSLIRNKIYCARTKIDAQRFEQLSIPSNIINITGTMKYDNINVNEDKETKFKLQNLFQIDSNDTIIVGGSTHDGEEEILINVFKALRKEIENLRLILVPRHIERTDNILTLVKNMGFSAFKKTELGMNEHSMIDSNLKEGIIIVDTIGELLGIYSLASCVFVGRSLVPFGGQNMMEPAGLAKPIIFGPHTFNFKEEADLLLKNNAAKLVKNENELLETTRFLLSNSALANEMGLKAQEIVLNNRGATNRNLAIVKQYFKSNLN